MGDGTTVTIALGCEEVEKLLDLLGHDGATADDWDLVSLVHSLYRQRLAFADRNPPVLLTIELSQKQLDLIHRYVTPTAFGQGGREFRLKLARAFVEIERREDLPDLDLTPPVDREEPGTEERERLRRWREGESMKDGKPGPNEEVQDA